MVSVQEIYQHLYLDRDRDEIRVLELNEASSEYAQPSGTLVRMSLKHIEEPFEALSYMWGPPTRGEKLQLGPDCYLEITDNLAVALRVLRGQGRRHRIWIDAVCINQEDLRERNHQVQMMRRIYSKASLVISWIDPYPRLKRSAIQKLNSLNESSTTHEFADRKSWQFLKAFWNDPYWKRVWVQQEISAAASWKVQCPDGDVLGSALYHYNRLYLELAASGMSKGLLDWTPLRPAIGIHQRFRHPDQEVQITEDGTFVQQARSLLRVLYGARELNCTDHRDRLYGLMSLSADVSENDFTVNYHLSLLETFKYIPLFYIERYRNLEFLSYAGLSYSSNLSRLDGPSWIPDWTDSTGQSGPSCLALNKVKPMFSKNLHPKVIENAKSIILFALKLTVVSQKWDSDQDPSSTPVAFETMTIMDFISKACAFALQAISSKAVTPTYDATLDPILQQAVSEDKVAEYLAVLARSLCFADYSMPVGSDPSKINMGQIETERVKYQITTGFQELMFGLLLQLADTQFSHLNRTLRDYMEKESSSPINLGPLFIRRFLMSDIDHHHMPFISQNGEIGMAPTSTHVSDEIWYIIGCGAAMVLRPHQDGNYQLVGEAYLEGYNLGVLYSELPDDALEGDRIRDFTIEKIVLR